ncbi:MAG: winged helix-turn-helix domain-containing protein [Polyangiaceae bacterium]
MTDPSPGRIALIDGHVDLASQRVVRGGRAHKLTTMEARLLAHLGANAGRDVPRAELLEKVWGYGPRAQTRAMDHTVARLRTKLEANPKDPRHLLTVHGVGYRFVPVAPGEPLAPGAHVAPVTPRESGLAGVPAPHLDRAEAASLLDALAQGDDPDLGRLAAEQDRLRAIHERFRQGDPALAARAVLALDPLYYARGPGHRHIELLTEAEAIAPSGALRASLLVARAEAWAALGDTGAAEGDIERAEEAAGADKDAAARALIARGNLRRRQARFDEASTLHERALAMAVDPDVRAAALRQLAGCDIEAGRFDAALERFRDLERRYRRAGRPRGLATVLGVMGNIHSELGELARAERCFRAAIELSQKVLDRRREGIAWSNLAVVMHERGLLGPAREVWERSLAIHREVVHRRFEGFAVGGIGVLLHEEGRVDEARLCATEALAIFREVGDLRFETIGRARLAVLGPTPEKIRADLSELSPANEGDAWAFRVLFGFAELADAAVARDRGDEALRAAAMGRARAACAVVPPGRATSFHRISARVLTAWISRAA